MSGERVSEIGKSVGENAMTQTALYEAAGWADDLMDAFWGGRGDREKTVRGRVAKQTGVPVSYLERLKYKTHEMNDVKGSVYRALQQAHARYVASCEYHENRAEELRQQREERRAMGTSASMASVAVDMGPHRGDQGQAPR